MKNKNISRNRSTVGITFYLAVSLPIILCVVILLSYNIDELDIVLSTISSLIDYSGFKTDGGWHFRLLLLLPFISIAHYIGFTMLKEHETTFEIQFLKGVLIVFYTLVTSLFFGSVGWVISVYLIKAFNYMHFYGNPIERLSEILNTYAYLKSYENLSNYLWANIVNFYIFCFVASLVHLILSKTFYPSKIEVFFANYITEKAQRNKSFKSLQGTKEDIIDLEQSLKKIKKYNPYSYFKKDKTFIGKDIQSGSSVYIDDDLIKRQKMKHLVISGSTGCGKGAQTQVLLNQFLIKDYPIIAIDPNNDEFMIKSLKYNAEKRGKKFHLIDFKEYAKPQIDLLQGANSYEFIQITNTLFPALKIKETDGNYYAQFSRDARQNYYEKELGGVSCMYDLHKKVFDKYGEEALKDVNGNLPQFVTEFLNFAKIPMFMVKNSLSIKDVIENGDIIYILTPDLEADDELAYLCKAFLVRIIQIISNRDIATSRHVVFFIDEFGDYVNKILQKALQKIRKKKCTLILNLTSFDELMGIKSDVTGESVMHSIETNCVKILYEQGSVKSAQKASEMTGEHIVNVERKRLKTNDAQKDIKDNSETIIVPQKENIYSASMFSNLPEGVALYMNKGLPQLIHTEILRIPDNVEYPTLIQAEPYSTNDSETDPVDGNDIMGAL